MEYIAYGLPLNFINLSDPEVAQKLKAIDIVGFNRNASHQKENMFLACSYMSGPLSNSGCMFNDHLLKKVLNQRKYCYTFNPASYVQNHSVLLSSRAGNAGGLYMIINIE